jgi:hypothetical protein
MTDGFAPGQNVNITTDNGTVAGVFVRPGDQAEGITVESPAVNGPYKRDVGFVRRSDTDQVEPFLYELLSPA